ncbi:MAG: hypothetical protein KAW12_13675 [Candidatus Aminicenantes bacterium]|nr:hypothetical protein [Candidatus Aminicenantes bacterium]
MKKIVFFTICFLVSMGLLFSQSITVSSPINGQTYNTGDSIKITWTTVGISGNVAINLVKSDKSANYPIQSAVPYNSSPVLYTAPATVPAGDYFVRVKQSGVYGKSGVFTILGKADLLEGNFSIKKVTYSSLSSKTVNTITILVEYDAKKDFVICKNIPGKCDPEHGSMIVTYKIKNWKWLGDKAVPDYQHGCKFACSKGCGDITYPRGVLKSGKGVFLITIYPKKDNTLKGIRHQVCTVDSGWVAFNLMWWDDYYPELTVDLTLCISYLDPPKSFKHTLVTDSYTYKIILDEKDMQITGVTSCGW